MAKAILKNHRQSSRKMRLVADTIRGKAVGQALVSLTFTPKKAARTIKKVLDSAIANAKHNDNLSEDDLYVTEIAVDEGYTLKRWRARARGRAARIRKRTSHVSITVEPKLKKGKKVVEKVDKKVEKEVVKKVIKKEK